MNSDGCWHSMQKKHYEFQSFVWQIMSNTLNEFRLWLTTYVKAIWIHYFWQIMSQTIWIPIVFDRLCQHTYGFLWFLTYCVTSCAAAARSTHCAGFSGRGLMSVMGQMCLAQGNEITLFTWMCLANPWIDLLIEYHDRTASQTAARPAFLKGPTSQSAKTICLRWLLKNNAMLHIALFSSKHL